MKRREQGFGRQFWIDHVAKHAASGKSQAAYSVEHGIKHQTLSAWANKLARETRGVGVIRKRGRPPKSRDGILAKVVVAPAATAPAASMRLMFPGGIALDLTSGFDVGSVARLLAAVGGRP